MNTFICTDTKYNLALRLKDCQGFPYEIKHLFNVINGTQIIQALAHETLMEQRVQQYLPIVDRSCKYWIEALKSLVVV